MTAGRPGSQEIFFSGSWVEEPLLLARGEIDPLRLLIHVCPARARDAGGGGARGHMRGKRVSGARWT